MSQLDLCSRELVGRKDENPSEQANSAMVVSHSIEPPGLGTVVDSVQDDMRLAYEALILGLWKSAPRRSE